MTAEERTLEFLNEGKDRITISRKMLTTLLVGIFVSNIMMLIALSKLY